jgi:hypothetical protein
MTDPDPNVPADDDAPLLEKFGRYRKTVAALIIGGIGWATMVVTSDPAPITSTEWIAGATYAATAIGVFAVANRPKASS